MKITRFFLSAGIIAYVQVLDTQELDGGLLRRATECLTELQSGAPRVFEQLPCTVMLGTGPTDEIWESLLAHRPESMEGRDPATVRQEMVERARRRAFLLRGSDGHEQRYQVHPESETEESGRGGLHGSIGGMAFNSMFAAGRKKLSKSEERFLEETEEIIWRSRPAIVTGNLSFRGDLAQISRMISFGTYFGAAMLMHEA